MQSIFSISQFVTIFGSEINLNMQVGLSFNDFNALGIWIGCMNCDGQIRKVIIAMPELENDNR